MAYGVVLRVGVRMVGRGAAANVGRHAVGAGASAGSLNIGGRAFRLLSRQIGLGPDESSQQAAVAPKYNLTVTAAVDVSEVLRANHVRLSRIADLSPVWDYIADDFAKKEGTVFKKGGASAGFSAWAPLKQSTIERKQNSPYKKNASRILVRSGELRSSLTQRAHPNFIFRSTRRNMEIGTSVKYAGIHDAGDPDSGLPSRSLIRIPDKAQRHWNSVILRHLVNTKSFGFERLG